MKKTDVHTRHCCKKHGCKYGDKDCTVVTGKLKQEYPCESCYNEMTASEVVFEEMEMLVDEYALCPDSKLTADAIDLKNNVIYLIDKLHKKIHLGRVKGKLKALRKLKEGK